MPQVRLLAPDGKLYEVRAKLGTSLMRAAVDADIPGIEAECGGCCSCATCHVYLDQASAMLIPAPLPDEIAMLEFVAAERLPSSRLSCQIELTEAMEGLTAIIAPNQV